MIFNMFDAPKTAHIIPNTTVQCKYCNATIELDSARCVHYYKSGIIGIVCPSCRCFSKGGQ